jgi:hypothetical protein
MPPQHLPLQPLHLPRGAAATVPWRAPSALSSSAFSSSPALAFFFFDLFLPF